jgi:hypothetical protein
MSQYWKRVQWWYQRRRRGYDDRELRGLDYAIVKFVYPRLRTFRDLQPKRLPLHPTEHDTAGNRRFLTEEEWTGLLDEMIEGFEILMEDRCGLMGAYPHRAAKVERALEIFKNRLLDLWD